MGDEEQNPPRKALEARYGAEKASLSGGGEKKQKEGRQAKI